MTVLIGETSHTNFTAQQSSLKNRAHCPDCRCACQSLSEKKTFILIKLDEMRMLLSKWEALTLRTSWQIARWIMKSEKYHHKRLAGVVPLFWHEIESCPKSEFTYNNCDIFWGVKEYELLHLKGELKRSPNIQWYNQ